MADNFDIPPLYDPLTRESKDYLNNIWLTWFATFIQTLNGYLNASGISLPQLTTVERDSLVNVQNGEIVPIPNGQMIYNTTDGSAQYYKAGVWTSF